MQVSTEGIEVVADAWRTHHRFSEGQSVDLSWEQTAAIEVDRNR
jgi:hypothetical protein